MTASQLEAQPIFGVRRLVVTTLCVLSLLLSGCSGPAPQAPQPKPSSTAVDWQAMDAAIETAIAKGPAGLDNLRAVVVSIDGKTKLAHYRHDFSANDHEHVWSVTKSVVATLIGIAIGDGLITSVDQPLSELLPEHRKAMTPAVSRVTLRQLMSMSGGFTSEDPSPELYESAFSEDGDFIDFLLTRAALLDPGKTFLYSNSSGHLTMAVLASVLNRSHKTRHRALLDYARTKLFEPLDIRTTPSYSGDIKEPLPQAFSAAGFGWLTDPDGLPYGGKGLRLTPSDMIKIGELYQNDGLWHGVQVMPPGWADTVSAPSELNADYGLLWWIYNTGDSSAYAASGSYGQRIMVWPSRHAVIVFLAASPPDADDDLNIAPVLVDVIGRTLPRLT